LHVEVFDDDADEEVESEEGAEDDEEDEVQVHPVSHFSPMLLVLLLDISITINPLVGQIYKTLIKPTGSGGSSHENTGGALLPRPNGPLVYSSLMRPLSFPQTTHSTSRKKEQ